MIVIKHDLSGSLYNYNEAPVTDDPRLPLTYTLPKGYSLATDQTPVDRYLVTLVNAETGQYVESTRYPDNINPLDL